MSVIFEADIDPRPIQGKSIAVIGYGNQGRAHALNLRDRGLEVIVGAQEGRGRENASEDGFEVASISDAVSQADVIVLLLPDEQMGSVWQEQIKGKHKEGATYVFAHGFAVTYGLVEIPAGGAVLVSPSGPGTAVRESFLQGSGLPGFVGAEPHEHIELALAYAWAIGCGRGGVVETTFREETECDLFGEQVVLCGGMPELAIAAFETLVDAGFTPEVAYTECIQQVRLLADLMARYGVAGMKERISDTAEWGSYQVGEKIIDAQVRQSMKTALSQIQSGEFAKSWIKESATGKQNMRALREQGTSRRYEVIFRRLHEKL